MDPITIIKVWTLIKPIRRIRLAIARRKARKAGQLEPVSIPEENVVFPQGTMTKSGVILTFAGPILIIVLKAIGVGADCPADSAIAACQSAEQVSTTILNIVGEVIGLVGAVIAWRGYNRSKAGYPTT